MRIENQGGHGAVAKTGSRTDVGAFLGVPGSSCGGREVRRTEPPPTAANAASRRGGQQAPPIEAGSRPGPFVPRPGFRRQRRKESRSFFPAARTPGKIPLTQRRAKTARPRGGWAVFAPKRSALSFPQDSSAVLGEDPPGQMFPGTFGRIPHASSVAAPMAMILAASSISWMFANSSALWARVRRPGP